MMAMSEDAVGLKSDLNEFFRLRRSVQVQGIVFTAIFLAAALAYASAMFLDEPAKHGFKGEHSVAIVVGLGLTVFGTMTLLGVYTLVAYYVERVAIVGTTISVRSVFQNRQ